MQSFEDGVGTDSNSLAGASPLVTEGTESSPLVDISISEAVSVSEVLRWIEEEFFRLE